MAYPTVGDVLNQVLGILDDPLGTIYNPTGLPTGVPTPFQTGFNEAYDVLYSSFLNNQCPRIVQIVDGIALPPSTTSITPADMGIDSLGSFEWFGERLYGSTDKFIDILQLDRLNQRAMTDRLIEFVWRNNTFYFVGATTVRELQLEYDSSGVAPTDLDTQIKVDGAKTFLSNYTVAVIGGRKGADETATRCWNLAVGPKFNMGTAGGELFRLIQPLVRERQHVKVAPMPYTVRRRMGVGRGPVYVSTQAGTTGGGSQNSPVQFSSQNGTIVGVIDGVNSQYFLTVGIVSFSLFRNGLLQTYGTDYTAINNQINFLPGAIPQVGDILTANGYPQYQN